MSHGGGKSCLLSDVSLFGRFVGFGWFCLGREWFLCDEEGGELCIASASLACIDWRWFDGLRAAMSGRKKEFGCFDRESEVMNECLSWLSLRWGTRVL